MSSVWTVRNRFPLMRTAKPTCTGALAAGVFALLPWLIFLPGALCLGHTVEVALLSCLATLPTLPAVSLLQGYCQRRTGSPLVSMRFSVAFFLTGLVLIFLLPLLLRSAQAALFYRWSQTRSEIFWAEVRALRRFSLCLLFPETILALLAGIVSVLTCPRPKSHTDLRR